MRKRYFGLVILIFIAIGISPLFIGEFFYKNTVMVERDIRCKCIPDNKVDIFEQPLMYKKNFYAGTCIDSCKYRYPVLIGASKSTNSIAVANILHNKEFWVGKIPMDKIVEVQALFENFAPGINHVAFRFVFSQQEGIQLKSQLDSREHRENTIASIVLSPEAAPPVGTKYNLWDGFVGNYALINRIVSYKDYFDMTLEAKHPLKFYKLKINLKEAQNLLTLLIMDSKNVYKNQYQLLFNNCATTVLDSALQAQNKLRSKSWDIWDVLDPMRGIPVTQPLGTIRSLEWWGLVDAQAPQEGVN